jgi:hypothetical protein
MATPALFVDGFGSQQSIGGRTVGVVAVSTGYLSFANRMVRCLPEVGSDVLVTGETAIGHRFPFQLRRNRHRFVDRVAIETGDASRIVDAAGPEKLLPTGVAGATRLRLSLLAQTINPRLILDYIRVLEVKPAGAVAGLAPSV